ncbi:hypothetical protein [Corallococcus exiguus]|uniref:Uncharacterized protein n=1 Tax=Corallococcus exiguus TaxID=83462 RepID=A0A7X5BPB5_9BACT|nr:hypothetical protein [Corallococcus exiguus]NBC40456.1 hypothetical protein [Corallococcus exiguus]TNV64061.1 hypothetical protein FH620_13560 [Corallococcus exiguus]
MSVSDGLREKLEYAFTMESSTALREVAREATVYVQSVQVLLRQADEAIQRGDYVNYVDPQKTRAACLKEIDALQKINRDANAEVERREGR